MSNRLNTLDKAFVPLLLISVGFILISFFTSVPLFQYLVKEDSVLENLTALFLFLASMVLVVKIMGGYKNKPWTWFVGLGFMALAFFFGAGEEISWGQRVFGIESSDYFKQNNAQGETNLHNIQIGEVKLNKLIFSKLLSVGFGLYFLVFPFLYNRNMWFKKYIDLFGIVLPDVKQTLLFVSATLLILGGITKVFLPEIPDGMEEIALDNVKRKWEAWEFIFGLTIFWITLSPKKTGGIG